MRKKQIRLSLHVSQELDDLLEDIARKSYSTKSDVLRKSIALINIAIQEREKGNYLGIINQDQEIIREIIGY